MENTAMKDPVHLIISSVRLRNPFTLRQLNPYVKVYRQTNYAHNPVEELGKTEIRTNVNACQFLTFIDEDYIFDQVQVIVLRVFDSRDGTTEENSTFIGEGSFHLTPLMRSIDQKISVALKDADGRDAGELEVRGESKIHTRDIFKVSFAATLPPRGVFSFSDYRSSVAIFRQNEDSTWTMVYRSSEIAGRNDPQWLEADIPVTVLNGGDERRPLKITVYQTRDVVYGEIRTNQVGLLAGSGVAIPLRNAATNDQSGTITATCSITGAPTLLEFIRGGLNINIIAAIDFTGSNGEPKNPRSLHFVHPSDRTKLNSYERSITDVGTVLEEYDTDKRYPVFGFGAKQVNPDGTQTEVRHAFNLHPNGEEVAGVAGILDLYHQTLPRVVLSGPTFFAPIIREAIEIAKSKQNDNERQNYEVLMLVTDGRINDMNATKQAIIEASKYAVSIVIVGVGKEDFSSMQELDSDDKLLQYEAEHWERDIVQFVPYDEAIAKGASSLAAEVLAEIPNQILQYYEKRGIRPNPPVHFV